MQSTWNLGRADLKGVHASRLLDLEIVQEVTKVVWKTRKTRRRRDTPNSKSTHLARPRIRRSARARARLQSNLKKRDSEIPVFRNIKVSCELWWYGFLSVGSPFDLLLHTRAALITSRSI